ncbi:MAG: hypothetical protein ACYTFW_08540 [Planctomycetota bacterium]
MMKVRNQKTFSVPIVIAPTSGCGNCFSLFVLRIAYVSRPSSLVFRLSGRMERSRRNVKGGPRTAPV